MCSQGLVPFIYERLINPANITKSIFHKIAAIINLPFVAFTGYTWGFGNTQALIALGLRKAEEKFANSATDETKKEEHARRANSYGKKIYPSAERLLTIGSISNPVMPCLQYCADGLHSLWNFINGEGSIKNFFQRPILSICRAVSTIIALPEVYAKGVDAFMRVTVNEREHLKSVLPESLTDVLEKWGNKLDGSLKNPGILRKIKNFAEMIFHTLSPFAMFSLFAPMIDRKNTCEEAKSRGGITALLDKVIGGYAKTLTYIFTGFYVLFSRLPQGILQSTYFGRKLFGKYIKRENEITTQEALKSLSTRIRKNILVEGISKFAQNCINYLVPNWFKKDSDGNLVYNDDVENEYGTPNYKQVLAKYSFDQVKEYHKLLCDALEIFSLKKEESKQNLKKEIFENLSFEKTSDLFHKKTGQDLKEIIGKIVSGDLSAKEPIRKLIVDYCLNYSINECRQGNYELNTEELSDIESLINRKLSNVTGEIELQHLAPKLPGALFLVRTFLTSLDLKSRTVNWSHDKLLKLEVYEADEKNKAFNNELEVVCAENADCARRFVNWVQGIPVYEQAA